MSTHQEICDMVVQAVKQITGESSNSVKLKQPHEYSGERDVRIIDNWCSAIETHKDFYGWGDDKAFIFASTLMAGRAAEWLRVYKEYHPNDAPKTWTALKAELLQNFRPARSVDDARDALDSLVQTGSMQEYCDSFMDIIMLIPGMTQEEQCHQFRKGIQDMELQAQLRDYQPAQRKIQTYFTHALNYAATRPHLGSSGTSSFSFGGNRGMAVTRGAQQQGYSYGTGGGGGTHGGVEPMDLDAMTGRGNSSTVVCYFCNKPGHVKRHCRERIEAIRKLDNTHRYNNGGSGSPKGKKKQFYKKPRGQLNAMDNSNDSPPSTAHDDNDDNKLNTTCEHYVKGSSLSNKKTKCQSVTAKMVEPLSARLDSDVPHLDQLNSATSSSSCDLPLYGGFAYSHGGDRHVPVKVLVDSGASECYIKPNIAQQLEGIWSKVDREVETAGGTVHKITEKLDYVLNLQGYKVPVSSFVYDSKFDIILGRSWLKQHKPQFNWDNDTLTFYDTTVENMVAKYLITPKQVDRLLKHKEAEVYLLHVCEDHNKEVQITMSMDTEWKKQLSQEYPGVFQSKLSGVPSTQEVEHVIDTGDAAAINKPAYKMSPLELDELKRQLKELLAAGMIRPSTSPWGSPVLFVKKKDGSMRMCIDYRALNKVTVRNTFPLPRIDECLDRLKGASYFSCLDLKSGYHQIRIKDTDIPKTAMNTRYGKFEWSVLGMGLCNSPPTFQAWMNKLLGYECIDKFALCYLDDVCIFSPTLDSHKKHIKIVLDKFKEAGLIVNIDKCRFAQQKLVFLGFEICQHGIQPSAQKVKAVQEWPTPSNVQEVRQFMGLAQHYRRFIKAFAHIAAPLTNLTQGSGPKKRAIEWTDACESSFQQLKRLLTSAPVLMVPDMSKPFRIETDSSDFGVGGVLLQPGDGDSKQWHPVAFESKKLSLAEQKLPAQERELIGIVHALRTWRCYIDGCPGGYVVCCDHNPLTYFRTQQKPTPRLVRWIADLEMFAPKIVYKPGKENVVADALSRIGDASQPAKESLEPLYLYASWSQLPKELQSDWPLLYAAGTDDKVKSKELKAMLKREKPNFTIKNGRLFRIVKHKEADKPAMEVPFVPFSQRADLVSKYHESFGHASVRNLMHLMGKRYWWPRMKTDITEWIAPCPACQLNSKKVTKHQDEMHPLPIPVGAFERWHLDFVEELPHTGSGNRWLITAVDATTNWPIACALPEATKEAVAQFIYKEIVTRFGCPVEFITDRGANFCSELVQEYVKLLGSHHKLTSAFHPRTNSKVERYNGTVKDMLRKYVQGALHRWDEYVDVAVWASRVWKNATTGYSPFFLVYGREPRLPGDAIIPFISNESMQDPRTVADITARELAALGQHRAAAQARMKAVSDKDKERWDKAMSIVDYEVGDLVLLTHEGKFGLEPRFKGPYIITQAFDEYGTYQLETMAGQKLESLVHRDRLKRAKGDKPDEAWYDPTASRRLVKAATSSRSGRVPKASLPSGRKGGGGSYPTTTGYVNVGRSNDATPPPTSITVSMPDSSTSNVGVPTTNEQGPELSSSMYGSQEGVSPFVDMTESLPEIVVTQHVELQQQEQAEMSDAGGDGNSIMEEDQNELRHVVDAYDDISLYEEEYDSAMSDVASGEQKREDRAIIKNMIEGYDDISSADEFDVDILKDDNIDKVHVTSDEQHEVALEEAAISDGDISVRTAGSAEVSSTAKEKEKVQEEQQEKDETADAKVSTQQGDSLASSSHSNQPEINRQGYKMQGISSQAGASSCHDDKMEKTDSHGDKVKDNSTTEGGNKTGSSGSVPKKISPFAFVEKQSKKPLSWQKFRGTDDSIHQNEDTVGPVATDSEDVEGPTSVSKGDNVIDMFDGLVPEAVLRHNANKRRVFKPTIPVRRQFRKKQKLTVVTDVSRNL